MYHASKIVQNSSSSRNHQRGLSLVELMIAMTLGLLLVLAVTVVFVSSSQTYRTNEMVAELQDSARFGTEFLQREIRSAGQRGCAPLPQMRNWLNAGHPAYVPLIHDGQLAVAGWEFNGTGLGATYNLPGIAISAGGWQAAATGPAMPAQLLAQGKIQGSDVLVVNRAEQVTQVNGAMMGLTLPTPETGLVAGSLVIAVTQTCSGSDLFRKGNGPGLDVLKSGAGFGAPDNMAGNYSKAHTGDANGGSGIYQYTSTAYYVGINARGEPALFRLRLDQTAAVPEEVVTGVESMQVLYGEATGAERQADRYVTAAAVSDWQGVTSVRLSLLIRADQQLTGEAEGLSSFNLIGSQINLVPDRRPRIVATTTIAIRSRLD